MKKFIKYLALMVIFGLAGIAHADQPFLKITTIPDKLDLGEFLSPGVHNSKAELTVKVESNSSHGPILLSITKLIHTNGTVVEPEQIFVKSPVTGEYISMKGPVLISKPTVGSHNIVLTFKVKTDFDNRAGSYRGTLVFTITPP